jgi:hypothetical protein
MSPWMSRKEFEDRYGRLDQEGFDPPDRRVPPARTPEDGPVDEPDDDAQEREGDEGR